MTSGRGGIDPNDGWRPASLAAGARAVVVASDPLEKARRAAATAAAWHGGDLSLGQLSIAEPMPDRPGRPIHPVLLPPRDMPKRSVHGERGRIALLHSLAHIELNAVDMTWDLVGRFAFEPMPRAFFDDWVQVGAEEAAHFLLVSKRLAELGAAYGDLPAHDGLWQAAQATGSSLIARIAVVPLVLEARGLDVSPAMIASLEEAGDSGSAGVLDVIYRDEKRHVACGAKWFRYLCERSALAPEPTFHDLVRRHFRGPVKPPFNDRARAEAGLTPGFYKPLVRIGRPA
ncbi:MAG: ferritin-like domain-containing protein [Hyphomicrobiaceae bacterium]|nr:ferritin-like domain-containing protein [Hyphomicrobiaceae bacterium]